MQKMEKRRKLNKVKVRITIFLIVLLINITGFGRYFYNNITINHIIKHLKIYLLTIYL